MSCNCNQPPSNACVCQGTTSSKQSLKTCPTTPASSCCQGMTVPKFNVSKAKTICGYIDRIYDYEVGPGSAIFDNITTDTIAYSTSIVVTSPISNCCVPCSLASNSVFNVSDCQIATLTSLTPGTALTVGNVLVNGSPVNSLTLNANGSYTATLSQSNAVPLSDCYEAGLGTKSTFMITNAGNPWFYSGNYQLYGTVNTAGQNCNFQLNFQEIAPTTATTTTSTFIIQNICIPDENATLNFYINGVVDLITPSVVYDPVSQTPIVNTNVAISPNVTVEVLQKTKVCMQAMVY